MWELIVDTGRGLVAGKHRQVSRSFRGNFADAERGERPAMARAILVVAATGLGRAEPVCSAPEPFGRMRERGGLDHLDLHDLRRFTESDSTSCRG